MSGLHPSARDLIEAAKRAEAPPSAEALARVHGAVVRHVASVAGGAALASAVSTTAKAGALAGVISKLVAVGVVGALAGTTWAVTRSWQTSPEHEARE